MVGEGDTGAASCLMMEVKFCRSAKAISFQKPSQHFSMASAVGQNFIFYVVTQFNPLVLTTVTTTRKIFSVLLDIVSRGYVLNGTQWSGVAAASLGVLGELQEKFGKKQHAHSK